MPILCQITCFSLKPAAICNSGRRAPHLTCFPGMLTSGTSFPGAFKPACFPGSQAEVLFLQIHVFPKLQRCRASSTKCAGNAREFRNEFFLVFFAHSEKSMQAHCKLTLVNLKPSNFLKPTAQAPCTAHRCSQPHAAWLRRRSRGRSARHRRLGRRGTQRDKKRSFGLSLLCIPILKHASVSLSLYIWYPPQNPRPHVNYKELHLRRKKAAAQGLEFRGPATPNTLMLE